MKNIFFLTAILIFISCNTPQKIATEKPDEKQEKKIPEPKIYRAAYTQTGDLVHTRLEVKFDWQKKQLLGKATITLHQHFYPSDRLILNAKGMDLHQVALVGKNGVKTNADYTYEDQSAIHIKLDKVYNRNENFTVFIDYTSKPEELPEGGSDAITRDKGLYFINADLSNPEKPRQVWTQGETESNSAWFPTIEDPQQKMTQEIYITVDTAMTTVSNGLLITSTYNNDGTKTDYWKQSLPAAPYLTMIAASNFAVVKDKWKNIEVSYYLDSAYAKYAPLIFGLTPEMIDFFSTLLGVNYVWEKYAQVVVHDYVSGAMENTTAVIHGTNMLQDSSDYVDGNFEDYISHELFHHWFGDLVTCESWSNVTLNESFANYGEYLWREYKYGRDDADHLNQSDQALYLLLSKTADPDLVRFDYENRDDVYDVINYHKGGRILHMLRKYAGDQAFFASLKLYLETNMFGSAEAHDLRIAFEKVTGEDLNWFFNEWYFNRGHPEIEITYEWNESTKTEKVTVTQLQDFEENPLYRIPLRADVYHDGKVERKSIVIEKAKEIFEWKFDKQPDLINMDAERMLLCEKKDYKSKENYVFQFYHAPLYLDRYEALNKTGSDYEENSPSATMMEDGLYDRYDNIRVQALKNIGTQLKANKERMRPVIMDLAANDSSSAVRMQAIKALGKYFKGDDEILKAIENSLNDISYNVQAAAFKIIADEDKEKAGLLAKHLEKSNGSEVLKAIATLYKDEALEDNNNFFIDAMNRLRGTGRGSFAVIYGKYLKKVSEKTWQSGIDILEEKAKYSSGYGRQMIVNTLEELSKDLSNKISETNSKAEELKKNNANKNEIDRTISKAEAMGARNKALKERIKNLGEDDASQSE